MQRDILQMKILKNTLTFDLYKNNQMRFHRWLFETRSKLLGNPLTWFAITLTTLVIVIVTFSAIHDTQEISHSEYKSLIQDEEYYADEYPEWKVMLEEAMSDGIVNEGENTAMRRYLINRWEEKEDRKKIRTKSELTNIIND